MNVDKEIHCPTLTLQMALIILAVWLKLQRHMLKILTSFRDFSSDLDWQTFFSDSVLREGNRGSGNKKKEKFGIRFTHAVFFAKQVH